MNIGASLIFANDLAPETIFMKTAAVGFTQVELPCHDNPVGRWVQDPALARRLLAQAGLSARTAHSPDSGWNNADPDDAVRRASLDAASSVFAAAAEAGVGVVVVHPNAPVNRQFIASEFEANFARSRESIAVLAERADRAGVRIAVENLPMRNTPRPGGRIEDTLRMIAGLGDHVGVCFDVGHSNANIEDPTDEIRAAGARILCVHLQDNDGLGEDQHLVPGDGTVDWPRVIGALAECAPDAYVNFEVGLKDSRTGAQRSVDDLLATLAALRERWTEK